MRKLLEAAPLLPMIRFGRSWRDAECWTKPQRPSFWDEKEALAEFREEVSRRQYLWQLTDTTADWYKMRKRFGCQRITNNFKWLEPESIAPWSG